MEINLPLKKGERPLFKSLELLENIYRDYKRSQNVYETTESQYIIRKVCQLHVLAEILKIREKKGLRSNSDDLFQHLKDLPLFFNTSQVKDWEIEKKWNNLNFLPYTNILINYEISFDTLTPSDLYQAKNETTQHIWRAWFKNTPINDLVNILEYSAQSLLDWNKKRSKQTNLEINIHNISKNLSISEETAKNWFYLQVLSTESDSFWNLYLKERQSENAVQDLIAIWEYALGLQSDSINQLLYADSLLIELGFYYSLNNNKDYNSWQEYNKNLVRFQIPYLNKKLLEQNNIIDLFLREYNTEYVFPAQMFSHIKGLEEKFKIIKNLKNPKILIYGDHLSGKNSLMNFIINKLGYKAYKSRHFDYDKNEAKNKKNEIILANSLLGNFKNSALVIQNAEENYELKDSNYLEIKNCVQFWTVSNIKDINKSLIKDFDVILEVTLPGLKERIVISSIFFKEESIAVRVAQTLKKPHEIMRIGKLCDVSQDWSWDTISILLSSFDSVENLENKINLNRLEIDENAIELVGYPDLEDLMSKLIAYYKNPNDYLDMGAKADKGILLVGPPGTGKTHFARNLSRKVNIPIFAPETSVLAGNLESINYMFKELKRHAPCILFLDEIDTLIADPKGMLSTSLDRQKIVNTFLSNIDGIESNEGILIIGATHRSGNFDPAAVRSGRLSKTISLSLPTENARKEIWKAHLKNKKLSNCVTIEELLQLSIDFSCADIMETANKAAVLAVENGKKKIEISDFKIACDETFWGYADFNIVLTEQQKASTAIHEAGHAFIAWKNGHNVPRVTIRPRNDYFGATHIIREEGLFCMSMNQIKEQLEIALGGICAEKVVYGFYDNGGTEDLKSAKGYVMSAICQSGLGQEGPLSLGDSKLWSNERKLRVEDEEKTLMVNAFENTEKFLELNKDLLQEFTEYLLVHKQVSGEIMKTFKNRLLSNSTIYIKHEIMQKEQVLHKEHV